MMTVRQLFAFTRWYLCSLPRVYRFSRAMQAGVLFGYSATFNKYSYKKEN